MKVTVITILDNTNFGTYLQALATCKVIERLGHEPEVIHYTRPSMTGWGQLKYLLLDRGLLSLLRNAWKIPRTLQLRNQDYAFLSKYVQVTKEYVGYEALQARPPQSDVYVVGSDQVWNSIYNKGIDKSFFLQFVPYGKKKVSYASSIGMDIIPENERVETIELLKQFNQITVREKAAKELLKKEGINSEVVLDPTLLLDAKDWSMIADVSPISFVDDFLLIYSVELKKQNQLIEYYSRIIANKKKLKIYQVSYSGTAARLSCADKFFGLATPDVFLNLMKKATFVIVSSFHGTAFAINFQKEFLTISANRFNSRVRNLLDISGLNERLVCDMTLNCGDIFDINYVIVNEIIDRARKTSIETLNRLLKIESK